MALWALFVMVMLQAAAGGGAGAVTGNLQMGDGSPAVAVRVVAMQAPPPNIRPTDGQNYFVTQPPVRVALTDDKGRYELPNLPAGRYYIVAGVTAQGTYYPTTTDIEAASVVTVDAGSKVDAINFKLLTSPGSRVRGRVTPPAAAGTAERAILSGIGLGELIEVPIRNDGSFEFGRVPSGSYLLSIYPAPPGLASLPFRVADRDASGLELVRPPVRTVTGRIVVENGPLPRSFLAFVTEQEHNSGTINPDGTFTAKLHAATHQVALGGLPVGYALDSVRAGANDVTDGLVVRDADISGVVISVRVPRQLPRLRGRIADATAASSLRVEATGPIIGTASAAVGADGSFEFPALAPGLYRVSVPALPDIPTTNVVVDAGVAEIQLTRRR